MQLLRAQTPQTPIASHPRGQGFPSGRRALHKRPGHRLVPIPRAQSTTTTSLGDQPTTTTTTTSTATTGTNSSINSGVFDWCSYWYPVHVLESIDPSRPHAVELLGKQLVLWRDEGGCWRAAEDACPHRLAPLSEGRLEADGTLQCSYHGWRFNGSGKCTEIPQAIDERAKATACGSSRSCLRTFPVREEAGLIWVWPTAGPAAEAAAAAGHLPLSKAMVAFWAAGRSVRWYRRLLEYSHPILVENLTDPSHLPFSHHMLWPGLKRSNAGPMPFSPADIPQGNSPEDQEARPVFSVREQPPVGAFSYPAGFTGGGTVCYTPPCAVVYQPKLPNAPVNELLAVPAGPGRSMVFTAGVPASVQQPLTMGDVLQAVLKSPKQAGTVMARLAFEKLPSWRSHVNSNKLFDQDSVFLHMQDRLLAQRGLQAWSKDYYMPVSCDSAIVAARRWADVALQQLLPAGWLKPGSSERPAAAEAFCLSPEAAAAEPRLPKQQINDRYSQHTAHCVICQAAMKRLQQQVAAAHAAAAALGAACVGVLVGLVLPQLVGVGAAAAAAAAPGSAGVAAGAAAAVAATLGVAALAAVLIARAAAGEVAKFTYLEFSHADNH